MRGITDLVREGFQVTASQDFEKQAIYLEVLLNSEAVNTRYVHSTTLPFDSDNHHLASQAMKLANAIKVAELTSRRNKP